MRRRWVVQYREDMTVADVLWGVRNDRTSRGADW